jgi:hypothetical protein
MRGFLVLLVGVSLFCVSCGSNPPENTLGDVETDDLPEWVLNPRQVEGGDLYGVGITSGVRNKALAIKTSENRAIANIARVFEVKVEALMQDYMSSTLAEDMDSSEEQDIINAQRTLIDQSVSGIVIVNRYIDPEDGTVYVRARLDIETFEENLDKLNTISLKVKEYVKKNARQAFEELDEQLEKE